MMVANNDVSTTQPPAATPWVAGKRRAILTLALIGLVGVTACSSSEPSANGVASVDDDSSGTDDSTDTSSADSNAPASDEELDPELVFAEYDKCMEDEGVDMSTFGDSFGLGGGGNELGEDESADQSVTITLPADFDTEAFEAASEVCDPILEQLDANMTPEQDAAVADMMVDLENCLKDKGFDIPMTDGGGNALDGSSAVDTLPADMDFEAFNEAFTECQDDIEVPEILTETTAP